MLLDRGGISPMESYIGAMVYTSLNIGYASALTWVMFVVTMTIAVILFQTAQRWVYFPEEGEHEAF